MNAVAKVCWIQIKCPYYIRNGEPDLASFMNNVSLQKCHRYYYQLQVQMFVCSVEYGDFVVCTFKNDVPTLLVERLYLDEDFLVEAIVQGGNLFTVAILPELLGRWFTWKAVIPKAAIDDSGTLGCIYCYCKQEQGGEMVCCDTDNCPFGKWFHLSCLNLKRLLVPKSGVVQSVARFKPYLDISFSN